MASLKSLKKLYKKNIPILLKGSLPEAIKLNRTYHAPTGCLLGSDEFISLRPNQFIYRNPKNTLNIPLMNLFFPKRSNKSKNHFTHKFKSLREEK